MFLLSLPAEEETVSLTLLTNTNTDYMSLQRHLLDSSMVLVVWRLKVNYGNAVESNGDRRITGGTYTVKGYKNALSATTRWISSDATSWIWRQPKMPSRWQWWRYDHLEIFYIHLGMITITLMMTECTLLMQQWLTAVRLQLSQVLKHCEGNQCDH